MVNFVIVVITIFIMVSLNRIFRITEGVIKSKKGVEEEKKRRSLERKYEKARKFWAGCEGVYYMMPFRASELECLRYDFWLGRIDFMSLKLKRSLTMTEVKGLIYIITIIGAIVLFCGLLLGGALGVLCIILGFLGLVTNTVVNAFCTMVIQSQDMAIEKAVPDFYLLVYAKLVTGGSAMQYVLRNYSKVLQASSKNNDVMKKFIADWLGYIKLQNEPQAIRSMLKRYNSPLVVNLLNIILQRLDGSDNKDKLLTFKVELASMKLVSRRKQAQKMKERGLRMTMVVYVILAEVVLISITSRFPSLGGATGSGGIQSIGSVLNP